MPTGRTLCLLAGFLFLAAPTAHSQASRPLRLMPMPANIQPGTGALRIDSSFSAALFGYRESRLDRAVERFLRNLSWQTGIPGAAKPAGASKATLVIQTGHAGKDVQELGEDESYVLEVTPSGAKLTAPTPLGTMHGLETFLQLVEATPDGFALPAVTIQDKPRFPWRGLLIDVSRHFIALDVLKRNLDGMAAVKLNVFHWHLSENQGFRIESKTFPRLHQMGSDGFYYTQDEVRNLIAYARDRGIRVVPEFDMPGHATAWFVGHPELASAPGPYEIERKWGIFDPAMDPTRESTYKFLDKFIGEMARLFPDRHFHIGGDEVNGKQWDANPAIQEFIRAHNLKNNEGLQAYFNTRIQRIVSRHGKSMVGWDEIFHPDVPKDIVIQSWRGPDSLAAAAKQGYRGLLSFGYYLDLMWWTERHYAVDPLSGAVAGLSPEERDRILGGEACMWSEFISPETIDSRIWPRLAAIAERLWSPQETRDVASMYDRMAQVSWRLGFLGLTHNSAYRPMLHRIAESRDITAVRVLADVVEPVKDYNRGVLAVTVPTSRDPLNRVVDAARPESETARVFSTLTGKFIAAGCRDAAAAAELRRWLVLWRDNHVRLQPLAQQSFLLKEVAPLSQNLSAVASAGFSALDYLARGERAPDSWKDDSLTLIESAGKPTSAQLLLMPVPSIRKLIEAASSGCQPGK